MSAFARLPALAAVLLCGAVVACAGPQSSSSSSPGATPVQAASNGYPVPHGYVSGEHIIPYAGHIATKCDDFSDPARTFCMTH